MINDTLRTVSKYWEGGEPTLAARGTSDDEFMERGGARGRAITERTIRYNEARRREREGKQGVKTRRTCCWKSLRRHSVDFLIYQKHSGDHAGVRKQC